MSKDVTQKLVRLHSKLDQTRGYAEGLEEGVQWANKEQIKKCLKRLRGLLSEAKILLEEIQE